MELNEDAEDTAPTFLQEQYLDKRHYRYAGLGHCENGNLVMAVNERFKPFIDGAELCEYSLNCFIEDPLTFSYGICI